MVSPYPDPHLLDRWVYLFVYEWVALKINHDLKLDLNLSWFSSPSHGGKHPHVSLGPAFSYGRWKQKHSLHSKLVQRVTTVNWTHTFQPSSGFPNSKYRIQTGTLAKGNWCCAGHIKRRAGKTLSQELQAGSQCCPCPQLLHSLKEGISRDFQNLDRK